jgi:hypothetical protein
VVGHPPQPELFDYEALRRSDLLYPVPVST